MSESSPLTGQSEEKFWNKKNLNIRLAILAILGLVFQLIFGFEVSLSWPATMPASAIILVVGVNVFILVKGKRGMFLSSLALVLFVLMSFPWWSRGPEGWLTYSGVSLASLSLLSIPNLKQEGWSLWFQRAGLAGMALLMCLSASSISHLTLLAAMIIPVAILTAYDTWKKERPWSVYGDRWLLSSIALVLGNALVRYVPDPKAELPEAMILFGAGAVFAIGVQIGRWPLKSTWKKAVISLVLPLLGTALALWCYTYEGEAKEDGPSYDYGSFP